MLKYLEFKEAKCKNCYKCLKNCPVKAIRIEENQAKIRAMLDGTYDSTYVTSENMSNRDKIEAMLNGTYTNQDSEYQRRLQKIRDMLK